MVVNSLSLTLKVQIIRVRIDSPTWAWRRLLGGLLSLKSSPAISRGAREPSFMKLIFLKLSKGREDLRGNFRRDTKAKRLRRSETKMRHWWILVGCAVQCAQRAAFSYLENIVSNHQLEFGGQWQVRQPNLSLLHFEKFFSAISFMTNNLWVIRYHWKSDIALLNCQYLPVL